MKAPLDQIDVAAAEMPFPPDALVYSRTDKRGVILAGNAAFQRISGFSWQQLIGAPHRIVRNLATPRGVFHLMWHSLQSGEPGVAYIRNTSQDGRFYWVLATVLPVADGYLSVQINPTSPMFSTIKGVYAKLGLTEQTDAMTAEASGHRLLAELATLGYPDYPTFMQAALLAEYRARTTDAAATAFFADGDKVTAGLAATATHQVELLRSFDRLRDLPTNMRIIASRLEPSGGPITAISDIYSATSGDLFREITDFAEGKKSLSRRMQQSFEKATFLRVCALLQSEAVLRITSERRDGTAPDSPSEAAFLGALCQRYAGQAQAGLVEAGQLAAALSRASSDLRRSMLGLDTIRVMGRVESGRLGAEGNRIGATIDQIDVCHSGIVGLLQKIMDSVSLVSAGVSAIRNRSGSTASIAAK